MKHNEMTSIRRFLILLPNVFVLAIVALPALRVEAGICGDCCGSSPLILDLPDHGFIRTTTLSLAPVAFDIDADGYGEIMNWTYRSSQQAFLWLDLNQNLIVDDGAELFGTATRMPDGTTAGDGFLALSVYDRIEFGGNEDGWITPADSIWRRLRLWIDESHDGFSELEEISNLDQHGVAGIDLSYWENLDGKDGNGNFHRFQSNFLKRVEVLGQTFLRSQLVEDVFFVVGDDVVIDERLVFVDDFESGDLARWSGSTTPAQ